jgi:SAM-dependent methyltransferase
MSEHGHRTIERHCDVAVIGGSAAGLGAALQLGRQRRSVIVVDAGEPSNAPAAGVQGHLGHEGVPPSERTAIGREEVRSYGVEVLDGRVIDVVRADDGRFRLELVGGTTVVARRVLAATGLVDGRPDIDGLDEHWGVVSSSLAREDLEDAARPSANQVDWDHRYGGDRMWSGNPNGTLVQEVRGLAAGRALDVGAGEGGDAVWLAEQGWTVTASDISARALERVAAEAGRRGLRIACLHVDANALEAFERAAFDLVSAQYASIPRTPDDRGVRNLLDAVAPGGTLLVVSHDLTPMRTPIDTHHDSRAFDPDAYVRVDDVLAALTDSPDWDVELHETRPRPPGAASASHHVDDVVLRARRIERLPPHEA